MEPAALLEALAVLAAETGLVVQRVGGQPAFEGLSPSSSGVCRIRGEVRVLLSDSDPLVARIQVLARALQSRCGAELEGRFLAPAVRQCLEELPADP